MHDQASRPEPSVDDETLSCVTPLGGVAVDLTYRDRHIAGSLTAMLERSRQEIDVPLQRARDLQTSAATVLARPWPRWRRAQSRATRRATGSAVTNGCAA